MRNGDKISLFLAQKARKVYGIEIVQAAITDANANASRNNIINAEFTFGDIVEIIPGLYGKGIKPDIIVVDPPRAGCAKQVLETFAKMHPKKIIYVSCNPASLAHDLAILNDMTIRQRKSSHATCFRRRIMLKQLRR